MKSSEVPVLIQQSHKLEHDAMRANGMLGLGNFYNPGDFYWRMPSTTTFDPLSLGPGVDLSTRGLGSGRIQMPAPRLPGAFGFGPTQD